MSEDRTFVRCIVVETETEVPGLALIQLHDDQPPVHYVPLADLVAAEHRFEVREGRIVGGEGGAISACYDEGPFFDGEDGHWLIIPETLNGETVNE